MNHVSLRRRLLFNSDIFPGGKIHVRDKEAGRYSLLHSTGTFFGVTKLAWFLIVEIEQNGKRTLKSPSKLIM